MKRAMKKFIAVVMVLAMLLSTGVTAFAAQPSPTPVPIPQAPERDHTAAVSLYVHHSVGTMSDPVAHPGEWITPDPPTFAQNREPATGTIWRAARIEAPPSFVHETHPGPPDGIAGAATIPLAIRNAIEAGNLQPESPAGSHRRQVTGHPGWYVTSNNFGGASTVIPNPGGTDTPAIDGVLQAITGDNSLNVPVGVGLGIAHFTEAMMNVSATDPGQGLWLVWEVYNTDPASSGFADRTPEYGIIPPFLVNLPHFRHQPDPSNPAGQPAYPGAWLYRVHVFPKQPAPVEYGKTATNVEIGINPGPGIAGSNVGHEYALIDWRIVVGVPEDIASLAPVPPGPPIPPATPAPGSVPHGLRGPDTTTTLPTHILIQDVLDYRLRLLLNTYASPTNAGANIDPTHWLSVSTRANAAATPVAFPREGSGTNVNWELVTTTLTGDGTTVRFPYPHGEGAAGLIPNGQTVQVFWVHITSYGIATLAAMPYTDGRALVIDFRTIMNDLTEVGVGAVYNRADLNFGNRPVDTTGGPDDPGTPSRTVILDLDVLKTNPSNQALDGAVFFLYRCYQMDGAPGDPNRVPLANEEPYRIAISGGHAGNQLGIATLHNDTLDATTPPTGWGGTLDEWELVWNKLAMPGVTAGSGIARFTNLPMSVSTPARNNWYLVEVLAPPGGYRRVVGYTRLMFTYTCTLIGDASHDCSEDDCIMQARHNLSFTNTRDFVLPMTGGAGTILFTTAGVSLMGIAGLFLFLARKKDRSKDIRTVQ